MRSGYTPFGEFFKVLRIKNHEVLGDASKLLNVSSAYVSSVECGKRPVPEEWVEIIIKHYNLTESQQIELKKAVDNSKTSLKINLINSDFTQRNVALQFQRSFEDMDEDTAKEILKILKRNNKGGL